MHVIHCNNIPPLFVDVILYVSQHAQKLSWLLLATRQIENSKALAVQLMML